MLKFQKRTCKTLATALMVIPMLGSISTPINPLAPAEVMAEVPDTTSATTIDISKATIENEKITINIDKDGTYILTGSNLVNEAYVDTSIIVVNGVNADIILDGLDIINDDGYAASGDGINTISPLIIDGTANIYTKTKSSIKALYGAINVNGTLNIIGDEGSDYSKVDELNFEVNENSLQRPQLITGSGNINVKGGKTNFNFNGGTYTLPCGFKALGGIINMINSYDFNNNITIDGSIVNNLSVATSWHYKTINTAGEEVFKRSFDSLPASSEIIRINDTYYPGIYTDENGKIENIYLPKKDITIYTDHKSYNYTYDSEADTYTADTTNENCYYITFVDGDKTIKKTAVKEGEALSTLPSSDGYDYTFTYGENNEPFTTETIVTKDTTVNVAKKTKQFTITIDGEKQTLDYGTKLSSEYIYVDSNNIVFNDGILTKDLTAYKGIYDEKNYKTYFCISSVEDLKTFVNLTNTYDLYTEAYDTYNLALNNANLNAILLNDIDCTGVTIEPIQYMFYSNNGYKGTFDGNYHIIKNLTITPPEYSNYNFYAGFFAETNKATIKNLGLENLTSNNSDSSYYFGGIAGSSDYSTIENCYVTGNVSGYNKSNGLVYNDYNCNIKNCFSAIDNLSLLGEKYSIFKNCYDTSSEENIEKLKSGEAAYTLNEAIGENKYRQNLTDSPYPTFDSTTSEVYELYADCNAKDASGYTNDRTAHIKQGHIYMYIKTDDNTITYKCPFCEDTLATAILEVADSVYDGNEHKNATIKYSDNWEELGLPKLEDKITYSADTTNAGIVTATLSLDNENGTKAEISNSYNIDLVAKGYSGKYDGESHKAVTLKGIPENAEDLTINYKTADSDWTDICPEITTCGAIDVDVMVSYSSKDNETKIYKYSGSVKAEVSHNIQKIDKIEPTCFDDGYDEHYYCEGCDTAFSDENGENVIVRPVLPKKGHTFAITAKDNILTALCQNDSTHTATATLKAKNAIYDGAEHKTATIEYSNNWTELGLPLLEIVYNGDTTKAGKVTATAAYENCTATVTYSILDLTLDINGDNNVNDKDVDALLKKVLNNDYSIAADFDKYDIDNDGSVTATDVVIIKNLIKDMK